MTTRTMSPGDLDFMLTSRVAYIRAQREELDARRAARARHAHIRPGRRGGGARTRFGLASVSAAFSAVVLATLAFGAGYILNTSDVRVIDEAVYRGYNPGSASGTGVFDVFVQVAGGGSVEVKSGYNTDNDPEFETGSSATHNHSYKLSNVPIVFDPDLDTLTREFQLDVNQNTGANLSLDKVEVYLTDCRFITDYPFTDWTTPIPAGQCQNKATTYSLADLVYTLDKAPGGNNWLELDDDISAGSGKRDMILRIPQANFLASPLGDDPECTFQGGPPAGSACATYVVLYSHFGEDNPDLINTDGFEEWGVELYDLATKSGVKFNDLDADGQPREAGEPGLGGWTIYVDYSGNGALDVGEPSAVTESDGSYEISGIVPGTYRVREVGQTGWTCSFPTTADAFGCYYEEVFAPGGQLIDNDFGNYTTATKSGTKFNDLNANGVWDALEPGLENWRIYVDSNGNNVYDAGEPTDLTDSNGDYQITGINPGTFDVREVLQTGWTCSYPNPSGTPAVSTDCEYTETFTSGAAEIDNDFGNWATATKGGFKFNDNNMNGIYEPGSSQLDTQLTGWVIELWKLNGTWQFVAADPTDGSGYSFSGLAPGTYAVCEITQPNWVQSFPFAGATVPAGETVFTCATLATPNSGGTFAPFGIQFTATSGATFTDNRFGNFLVPPGCTLTQGYWKTHSTYGPAAHPDDTWDLITAAMTGGSFGTGPDSEFFNSGLTWIEVFQTNPRGGNAWVILAHQYMAAVLNQLNGAGDVPLLTAKLADAYTILNTWDTQMTIPKNHADRATAIQLAGFLAQYNEGQLGVPHCGEDGFTGFTTAAAPGISLLVMWPIGLVPLATWAMRRRRA